MPVSQVSGVRHEHHRAVTRGSTTCGSRRPASTVVDWSGPDRVRPDTSRGGPAPPPRQVGIGPTAPAMLFCQALIYHDCRRIRDRSISIAGFAIAHIQDRPELPLRAVRIRTPIGNGSAMNRNHRIARLVCGRWTKWAVRGLVVLFFVLGPLGSKLNGVRRTTVDLAALASAESTQVYDLQTRRTRCSRCRRSSSTSGSRASPTRTRAAPPRPPRRSGACPTWSAR